MSDDVLAAAQLALSGRALWSPGRGTVTAGGPPARAVEVRRKPVVCGVVPPRAPTTNVHLGHRLAVAEQTARRQHDRTVCVWMCDGQWHAAVHDGWGRLVEQLTDPDGCLWYRDASTAANQAWSRLRELPGADPERWELAALVGQPKEAGRG